MSRMVFERARNRLCGRLHGELLVLEPWGPDILRFRSSVRGEILDQDWTLLPPHVATPDIEIGVDGATITCGRVSARVTPDGSVSFHHAGGRPLLEELWLDRRSLNAPVRKARNYRSMGGDLYQVDLYFRSAPEERFYGLGQYLVGRLNLKGCVLELAQKNTQISVPFLVSTRGYGFLWNNPAVGRVELAMNHTCWHADATRQIDYLVIVGDTPAEIVRKFAELAGKPPALPTWALGFWQSKLRYRTQDEVLSVAREYRRRGLPLTVIVVDYFHWPRQGDWRFDPAFWPDPGALVQELEQLGVKLIVSIWPTVEVASENYEEMVRRGLLVRTERGVPAVSTFRGTCTYVDVTNPEARDFLWGEVRQHYVAHGINAFWLDMAEPEFNMRGFGYDNVLAYHYDHVRYRLGNGLEVTNIYPFYYAKTFWDGLKAEGVHEVVNLIRSAWVGIQRFGVVVWSGDVPSTFESLRQHVCAGLNMAMAGITWWTTDVGGFYGGDPDDPGFRELVVRWFQFGVFCPILRLHGFRLPTPEDTNRCPVDQLTGGPNEVWSFGPEVYEILKELLFMRERLRPYIAEQMMLAAADGTPIMRPLFWDFPEDRMVYEVEDQFMFGPSLLVAPVVERGAVRRNVYLPAGARWREAHTQTEYEGGRWVTCEAPLRIVPVYLRDDARIPVWEG